MKEHSHITNNSERGAYMRRRRGGDVCILYYTHEETKKKTLSMKNKHFPNIHVACFSSWRGTKEEGSRIGAE